MTPATQPPPSQPKPSHRYEASKTTLRMDRFMNRFITVGGISVILVVMAIFVFILWQVLPLFQGASVQPMKTVPLPNREYVALGVDEYSALPFVVDQSGAVHFIDLAGQRPVTTHSPDLGGVPVSAILYQQKQQSLIFGLTNGMFSIGAVRYNPTFEDGQRLQQASLEPGSSYSFGMTNTPVRALAYGESDQAKLVVGILQGETETHVRAAKLVQPRTLFGAGETTLQSVHDLTPMLDGKPVHLLASSTGDSLIVVNDQGLAQYLVLAGEEFVVRQKWKPFGDLPNSSVASMNYLLGDVSVVFSNANGHVRLFSLFVPPGEDQRLFGHTKTFPPLPAGADFYAKSLRNKAFLIGHQNLVSLRYGTTAAVRWSQEMPYHVQEAVMSAKYDSILLLDHDANLHLLSLHDPHPEASWQALFGKVWYEGSPRPKYEWQSTGGSDDFEPKLSLIPLIFGTLKGTFYAMLFAMPVALLAALYTSQFAQPRLRTVIKPVMEIMASLPSVVLGFLAALWLAPILENRVPSILLLAIVLPLAAMALGLLLSQLPIHLRARLPFGFEFLVFAPAFLLIAWSCWEAGPLLEQWLFVVHDPVTNREIADFRLWWPEAVGADFQQRNSLIVGFAMGFAVIPIIFTITEDSLSNVPASLKSGSLALGASRWQTAWNVILPTASAGIFSAVMIGLGRAVGETMIVVMATGNTPIMDWNIFNGMRTLSANLAVELPEAPHHGTLYRTLFLGAMVLFLMTFVINTLAELLRQRLRDKYKLV